MKKIISAGKINPEEIHENLKKGYGMEHPERVSGYAGFFINYGDVYASDQIAYGMECNKEFRDFVLQSIQDFKSDEYGMISNSDYFENVEDKWLAGGGRLFGRYPYGEFRKYNEYEMPEDFIKIRYYFGKTYVMYDSELDSECISQS